MIWWSFLVISQVILIVPLTFVTGYFFSWLRTGFYAFVIFMCARTFIACTQRSGGFILAWMFGSCASLEKLFVLLIGLVFVMRLISLAAFVILTLIYAIILTFLAFLSSLALFFIFGFIFILTPFTILSFTFIGWLIFSLTFLFTLRALMNLLGCS